MISAQEALQRLQEGNRRFVAGDAAIGSFTNYTRPSALAEGQEPFAIILGCSDSRMPAEILFHR
jgi:carbonic anhydrase